MCVLYCSPDVSGVIHTERGVPGACDMCKREKCTWDLMGKSVRRRPLGRQDVGIILKWMGEKEDRDVE